MKNQPTIDPTPDGREFEARVPGFLDPDCHPVTRVRRFKTEVEAQAWVQQQLAILAEGRVLS